MELTNKSRKQDSCNLAMLTSDSRGEMIRTTLPSRHNAVSVDHPRACAFTALLCTSTHLLQSIAHVFDPMPAPPCSTDAQASPELGFAQRPPPNFREGAPTLGTSAKYFVWG